MFNLGVIDKVQDAFKKAISILCVVEEIGKNYNINPFMDKIDNLERKSIKIDNCERY